MYISALIDHTYVCLCGLCVHACVCIYKYININKYVYIYNIKRETDADSLSGVLVEYEKIYLNTKKTSESHFFIPNCPEIDNQDVLTQGVTMLTETETKSIQGFDSKVCRTSK